MSPIAEVGSAFVSILPSARGFGRKLDSEVSREVDGSGKRAGSRFGAALGVGLKTGGAAAAVGAALFAKQAIGLEASFSKTMNVLKATTGATAAEMSSLSDLAIKMGADTAFSASDASQAMLELARGGIKPAQIEAGALQGTLTLAAAGELEMGEAANVAVKAMGAFSLEGKEMGRVAAALAGGANASSASVRDMSIALAQGGLAANAVGFSIEETTAVLASFSNAGIEGSDAGTSMKTMLDRLIPASEKAENVMEALGLQTEKGNNVFVKANGEFESAAVIAGELQKATENLSASERKKAISTIFGSDAQRAATVLAKEGAAGINELLKATSDQDAAQNMAQANMKGTAGALEQLKGSLETVTLQFGLMIAPAVQAGLKGLTSLVNGIVPAMKSLAPIIAPIGAAIMDAFSGMSGGGGFSDLADPFMDAVKAIGGAFAGIVQAVAPFVQAVLPSLISAGKAIIAALLPALQSVAETVQTQLVPALQKILPVVAPVVKFFIGVFGSAIVGVIKGVALALKGFITFISGVFNIIAAVVTGDWKGMWQGIKQIVSGAVNFVVGVVKAWLNLGILQIFKKAGLALLKGWRGLWSGLGNVAKNAAQAIGGFFARMAGNLVSLLGRAVVRLLGFWKNLFTGLVNLAKLGWQVLRSAFGGALAAIRTVVATAIKNVVTTFRTGWVVMKAVVTTGFKAIVSAVTGGASKMLGIVKSIPGRIVSALGNLGSLLFNAGASLIQGLINGVLSKIDDVKGAMGNVAGAVKGFFPGSPVKEGPLTSWNNGAAGKRLVGMLADGLSYTSPVEAAAGRLAGRVAVPTPSMAGVGTVGRAGSSAGGVGMSEKRLADLLERAVERGAATGMTNYERNGAARRRS